MIRYVDTVASPVPNATVGHGNKGGFLDLVSTMSVQACAFTELQLVSCTGIEGTSINALFTQSVATNLEDTLEVLALENLGLEGVFNSETLKIFRRLRVLRLNDNHNMKVDINSAVSSMKRLEHLDITNSVVLGDILSSVEPCNGLKKIELFGTRLNGESFTILKNLMCATTSSQAAFLHHLHTVQN